MALNILPLPDSSTQHINDKGKPTKDFTNFLKSLSDFANKTAQTFKSLVVGSPTGGNKGDGSINSQTIYLNGTSLGTASTKNVGTSASNVVQLDGSAKLPAVDGSQLTGLPGRLVAGTPLVLNPYALSSATTQAHGLGVAPTHIELVWECLTTNLNYSAGDKIIGWPVGGSNGTPTISFDATNLALATNTVALPVFQFKTASAAGAITAADWKLTITPYKLT
jgi:hypothetical protein